MDTRYEELTQTDYTTTQLQKFNVTDAALAEMKANYMPMTINGLEDKEGYTKVHAARISVRDKRIEVEKKRKELLEDSRKYQNAVNGEAKRITTLLEPIEQHLSKQEEVFEKEKERIKAEKEALEAAKLQGRINQLLEMEFVFSNGMYRASWLTVNPVYDLTAMSLKTVSDRSFEEFINNVKTLYADHKDKLAEKSRLEREEIARLEAERKAQAEKEEVERQAELSRIADEKEHMRLEREAIEQARKEQEAVIKAREAAAKAEQERLETIARTQAEQAAKLLAQQQALEAEKAALAEAAQRRINEEERPEIDSKVSITTMLECAAKTAGDILKDRERLELINSDEAEHQLTEAYHGAGGELEHDRNIIIAFIEVLSKTCLNLSVFKTSEWRVEAEKCNWRISKAVKHLAEQIN